MRALVYTSPRGLELRDVAQPVAGEGQTVVDVAACGICGSDMHAYLGHDERRPPPLVLGHEAAGVALEGPLAGRRVTVNPLESCGNCDFCVEGRDNLCPDRRIISMPPRDGAFAEQVVVPELLTHVDAKEVRDAAVELAEAIGVPVVVDTTGTAPEPDVSGHTFSFDLAAIQRDVMGVRRELAEPEPES